MPQALRMQVHQRRPLAQQSAGTASLLQHRSHLSRTPQHRRHILNTLSTFANSMDAQRLSHLALLEHESEQVACLGEQMRQSLLGMQGMLQGRVAVAE